MLGILPLYDLQGDVDSAHYMRRGLRDSSDRDHDRDLCVVGQGMGEPTRLRLFTEALARASDPTHPAHEYIAEHHRLPLAYAAKLLRVRQDNGLAHPDADPERFGREMVAIWDGLPSPMASPPVLRPRRRRVRRISHEDVRSQTHYGVLRLNTVDPRCSRDTAKPKA
jgi:hypothetical protein